MAGTVTRRTAVAVALSLLVAAAAVPASAAAEDGGAPSALAPAATACFPDGGHEFAIGTEGPRIDLRVHASLLTNLGGPGALGVEARGTTGEHRIVSLDAGVLFAGVGDPARFLRYPFDRFALAFRYAFEVPTLPDVRYESDEVPVVGPVGAAAC